MQRSGGKILQSEGRADVLVLKNCKEANVAGVVGARAQREGDELREARVEAGMTDHTGPGRLWKDWLGLPVR